MSDHLHHNLSRFRLPPGFRGRSGPVVLLWQIVQNTLFAWSPQPLHGFRAWLLRAFGAQVGRGVVIRPSARVTYPWKVSLGDYCWVGDRAELYSLGEIRIGSDAVVSQDSYLCAGSHDPASPTFAITARPILVEPEAWIAAGCFVHPGVTVGRGAVVAARAVVRANVPAGKVAAGHPAVVIGDRPAARPDA